MTATRAKLSGHIFSAFQACPQRAWLDLHGDRKKRLFSPMFLSGMQREGLRHEREAEEIFFPNAVKLEDKLSVDERLKRTEALLQQGTPVILQGAVADPDGVGIVDVLEHVQESSASSYGHIYRVGEIKLTESLKTGHIFQALWYRHLLQKQCGTASDDILLITGSLERRTIPASIHQNAFHKMLADLQAMHPHSPPGAHLGAQCPTCTWRGICMQKLSAQKDISLLPRLSRADCRRLMCENINTWPQAARDLNRTINALKLDAYAAQCITTAAHRLQNGGAVSRELLNWPWISSLQPIAVDVKLNAHGMPERNELPKTLLTADGSQWPIESITPERLNTLLCREETVVYGEADLAAIQNLARHFECSRKPEPIVLARLVQAYVHEPLLGYELSCVYSHAQGRPDPRERILEPALRIQALKKVRDWIAEDAR